jgi:N-acylneuraminate cytidylyltransferase
MITLIPVRSGSKRIPGKAMRDLAGHPLLAYTLATATALHTRAPIVLVSNDPAADTYAADWPGVSVYHRSPDNAQDESPDLCWLLEIEGAYKRPDRETLLILRVTSPFRGVDTVRAMREAWVVEQAAGASSMRLVTPTPAHPGKAWTMREHGRAMQPVLPWRHPRSDIPWHSSPTQSLPRVYQQTAGAELTKWGQIRRGDLSGERVSGHVVTGPEALDLNTLDDWQYAEWLVAGDWAHLPEVKR